MDAWQLAAGSHRKLSWVCADGHRWSASVKNRVARGSGCPHCAAERRQRVARERSLAARFPQLIEELDPSRNGDLDPWTLPPATQRMVWWRGCPHGHPPWRARPWDRTRGAGCPYCAGVLVLPERSLAAHPELVAELDADRNGKIDPAAIAAGSPRRLWWRCRHGHRWQGRVARRFKRAGCPYCSGHRPTPERSLAAHPRLVAELDRERNGAIDPATVAARGDRRLRWRCPEGHVWQAAVKTRVKVGTGCPRCASSRKRGIPLALRRPDLLDEWVDRLNGGPPDDVFAGSEKRAWWRCSADPAHLWQAQVRNRVRQHSGCPYCAHTRVAPATSLAATRPELAAEWHPARNHPLSPSDVLPGASRSVWWRCPHGHAWLAPPSARTLERGCPTCAAGRRAAHYRSDRSRLQPLRAWADQHGAAPTENQWRAARMRPSVSTFHRRFGSWNAALQAAGLQVRPRTGGIR